jgi:two-component system, chemotaxis family, chemotaxis protein CheY
MKILIVDDSTFMRTILKNILLSSKYGDAEMFEASNGDEAVALYNQQKPDLILLDIIMPGKDGIAVLKEIGPGATSVVIISSIDQPQVIEQAKSLGAKGYIVKPYDSSEVTATLESLI